VIFALKRDDSPGGAPLTKRRAEVMRFYPDEKSGAGAKDGG
jgi:hypothetical protein